MKAGKTLKVGVVRLPHAAGLPLPAYQSEEAAGLDLMAAVDQAAPMTLAPGARALVPTGLLMELPAGYEAQVRPRSGLAFKHGLTVLNSPGTIDSDYRGEVKILLVNLGQVPFVVRRGERIAQLVVATVTRIRLAEKKTAGATLRGAGGFGSTGTETAARPASKAKPETKSQTKAKRKPVTKAKHAAKTRTTSQKRPTLKTSVKKQKSASRTKPVAGRQSRGTPGMGRR